MKRPQPLIAFCTTCKGRTQHLAQTLPDNLADNATYERAKFIVLDYGSGDNLIRYLKVNHADAIESGRLVVYSLLSPLGPFRMAHAKNMAHRLGILEGADILVNLDADNFTGPDFAHYVADQFESEDDVFLWSEMIRGVLPRGIHGRIAVSKRAFLNSGGYDEKYDTWGPDDKDFNARLRRLGYWGKKIHTRFLERGVAHNDRMRFKEYPHVASSADYDDQFNLNGETSTIANWGKVGCGKIAKQFQPYRDLYVESLSNYVMPQYPEPFDLAPFPTRIFGIGMHKTATTSLHTALGILGFDSIHWKTAHWAKSVYHEMMEQGRSLTLEKHYAACDLPITILYRELDKAYPGSKFILTVKDEDRWLQDVRDHWGYDTNVFRHTWDKDPFSHKLHQIIYGQRQFDAEVFLARYRRHNDGVLRYFNRSSGSQPGDLLVMDMDNGAGWPELCAFLDCQIPAEPYPRIDPTRPEPIESMIRSL